VDELTKIEVGLIGKLLAAISIESFRDLITKNVLDAFITSHENTNVEFNFGRSKPDPEAVTFLREREIVLSDKTASKLEGDLKYQLLEGLKGNESIDMITRRLGTIFTDMMPWQLERVARTEVLNAQNAGRLSAYEKSGVVEYKMIIGATDKRLCGLCRRMRGQVQELDQPFVDPENMGDKWMHPPFHPSGRCSTVPLMNLPDSTITIGGQTYAADKKLGKVEIPIDLLKARQKRKAWVVRYANGYAVQCFEDEADADYFIETSKKKGDGWFDFISKVYREVKPGWVIHRKGTKTTMKFMSPEERKAFDEKLLREDKRVNKVEVNTKSLLTTKEITVKGFTDKRGVWHPPHKRKVKVKTSEEIPEKDVPKEDISDKKPISMTPKNLKELKSFEDLGMMGGLHEPGSYRAKFNDDMNAMYKVMNEGAIVGEVSTYDISQVLDWNVVPETISTNLEEKGDGSCQRWVEGGANPYEGLDDKDEDHVKIGSEHFDDLSDRNFEVSDYLTFREKVITNMRHIVDNEDKITDYYNKYEGSDLLIGKDADEKSITLVLLSIKKNLDYIKTYCGKSK
jgi:SPP1 gp7 family putative phage head morphogenesis protein